MRRMIDNPARVEMRSSLDGIGSSVQLGDAWVSN